MKILYGVQGTGQGHISRSRALAEALRGWPVEVTWLFSGRPREALFDMDVFDDYQYRRGLTFHCSNGRINKWTTLHNNGFGEFVRDVRQLDTSRYDLIVSDYEPVTAWAARRQGRSVIGIGHQYAFGEGTPLAGASWWAKRLMCNFAPVDVPLGLHWHPYNDNVVPPILDLPDLQPTNAGHILVYLPFEDQAAVTATLRQFPEQRFIQYAGGLPRGEYGNVLRLPANVDGFKQHLASSAGVICNSGFELISECLQWRKPVLTKPVQGQMEQQSNALALQQLGYATTADNFCPAVLGNWLGSRRSPPKVAYPDVAGCLARWLVTGCHASPARLAKQLWAQVDSKTLATATGSRDPERLPEAA